MTRNQRILSLNNRTSVTGLIMNSDKSRLVASGLDKTISVWSIVRKNGVKFKLFSWFRMSSMRRSFLIRS